MNQTTILLAVLVFGPMLTAAILCFPGIKNERRRERVTAFASLLFFSLSLFLALFTPEADIRTGYLCGIPLHFRTDGFRLIYGCATAFLWLATSLFSLSYFHASQNRSRYCFFSLLTLGATMGFFYAADLGTAFLFFETASLASYPLVAHDETRAALRAAETYLSLSIAAGLAMLMGLLLLQQRAGTLDLAELYAACAALPDKSSLYLPASLLLAGFAAKAGMFPLHFWLPKAHPVAPAPASALLSGILTKTGVFGAAAISCNLFPADTLWGVSLLPFAAITMLWGAVLGLFSTDLKRTLACSSVSQIGFILTGVALRCLLGDGGATAVRGTLLHMLNHSLFKLILFLIAGLAYLDRHTLDINKLRGFGRGKPLLLFAFLMGALGISGIPFLSGYISKTLLHEAIVESIALYQGLPLAFPLRLLDAAFYLSGGLTVAYMTKLFVALFIEKGESMHDLGALYSPPVEAGVLEQVMSGDRKPYISRLSAAVLAFAAVLPALGIFPFVLDALADWGLGFFHVQPPVYAPDYFSLAKISSTFLSLLIGAAVYLLLVRGLLMRRGKNGVRRYLSLWPKWLDLENLVYRPLLLVLLWAATLIAAAVGASRRPGRFLSGHIRMFQQHTAPDTEPPVAGGFTLSLFLTVAGLCLILLYVFFIALRGFV